MSYNLLLDTNFNKIEKHWKLTNCEYKNGYLISNAKIYSIEQEIILPDPTRLYFSLDYICFDKNIKKIYCGIQTKDILETNRKKPKIRTRKRISVVDSIEVEKIKVIFIVEAKTENTKIYIDNPMLVDLTQIHKDWWPKQMLDKVLDYRYGYSYENEYLSSEIRIDNKDFISPYTETLNAKTGILAIVKEKRDWFKVTHNFIQDEYYLVKLDYKQINQYGETYMTYGETISEILDEEQLYIIFKANSKDELKIVLKNPENLPYLVNIKNILITNMKNLKIEKNDIRYLPFI